METLVSLGFTRKEVREDKWLVEPKAGFKTMIERLDEIHTTFDATKKETLKTQMYAPKVGKN